MSIPFDPNPPIVTPVAVSTPSTGGRVFAFLAGVALLVVGALMSVGMVLVGAAGMGIASFAQRQRRARLSRWGGWIASIVSVAAVCAIIAFVIAQMIPAKTWAQVKVAMDSASVESSKQPPPAWIDRMYPGMSERSTARRAAFSPSTQSALMMAGFGMIGTFFVGTFGTLGWAAGMLLGFGARGRWPGAAMDAR